jgi:hypothetical protein
MVRHSTFSLVAVRLCEMCDPDPPDLTVSPFYISGDGDGDVDVA